ncbi:MAG: hypothetical protein DRQ40_02155 [Gammaproteobacteria bacterium]|nr:MAG: hypothetical protein DRQ40_02155 [Gammaproteobacteria bacterium]
MSKFTPAQLIARYEACRTSRRTIEGVWNDITRLVFPYKGDMFNDYPDEQSIDWRENRDVFDSTAVFAAARLSASIHGLITNPFLRWFEASFRDSKLNEVAGAREWLEEVSEVIYQTLQDSNLNTEGGEMYQDLVGYGTSVLVEEDTAIDGDYDDWEGVKFQCIPIREAFFESDYEGGVAAFYRRNEWTAVQIMSKFMSEDVPETIREQAESAESVGIRHDVILCVYVENLEPGQEVPDVSRVMPADRRPIQWRYILQSDKTVLGTGGYYEMPAFAPRWRKMSGSQWGWSPAMIALPDIKTVNAMAEQGLAAGEKAIDPAIFIPEMDIFSDLDFTAGAVNVVRSTENIIAAPSGSDFQQEVARIDRLRISIMEAFHSNELELKESPAMTATEAMIREDKMQRLLGPTAGRINTDVWGPVINRTFMILTRAGKIAQPPAGLENAELDIAFLGPLSRAQSSDKIAAIDRVVEGALMLAETVPDNLDLIDFDEATRERARLLAAPATIINDEDKVEQLRETRAKAQEEAKQAAQMQQGSEMIKNVGGPEGVEQLTSQMQQAQGQGQGPQQ